MKNKTRRTIVNFFLVAIVLFVTSCADGFIDHEVFSPGVTGATMASPVADSVKFTPSADGTTVTISWPVVNGAGGYKVSFYKVDDPSNPVIIGAENQVVDGCSTTRAITEDTKYKFVIQTLGNTQYNNSDAPSATSTAYSTLLPTYATIPTGTDLAQYFTSHPIPSSTTELAYQLEAGGSYTMTGNVALPLTNITLRGDKVNHAKVTMSSGVFLSDGAGVKIKFIDFDCSGFTGVGLLTYNATQNANLPQAGGYYLVTSPVVFQSCKITGLATPLTFDNAKKYALQTFLIKDCIIGQNTLTKNLISAAGGFIKDLTIANSTLYNVQNATGGYMIQYLNSANVSKATGSGWASGSINITNCTFWQSYKTSKMANYSGMGQNYNTLTLQKCIFVDCGSQRVVRDLEYNTTMVRVFGYNTYWYGGVYSSAEVSTSYDNSSTFINTDPQLKDPANANFKVQGAAQIAAQTGDPRWLQ